MDSNEIMNDLLKKQKREQEIIYDIDYLNRIESLVNQNGSLNTKGISTLTYFSLQQDLEDINSLFWNLYFTIPKDKINIDNGEYIVFKRNENYYKIGYFFGNGSGTIFYLKKCEKVSNYVNLDLMSKHKHEKQEEMLDFDSIITEVLIRRNYG